jgi:hypothetical protein
VLSAGLVVVEDTSGSSLKRKVLSVCSNKCKRKETYQDDDTKPTSREQQVHPRLNLRNLNVEAGRDNSSLVEASIELDDDLAGTMVIDLLKLANVT